MLKRAKELYQELVSYRRYLHMNAEVHNELPVTQKFVMDKLTEMGLEPFSVSKSSVVVNIKGDKPGKVFLLRADMDALPMQEDLDVEYKSQTENMHACGHDLHTTMLLGAAKLLSENKDKINGTVKLMFQPAEETLTGAWEMIEGGVLMNPKVDVAMMIHAFAGIDAPTGTVFYMAEGLCSASSDWFDIHINGQGGHGAVPQRAIDPLVAMSNIHLGLQEINAREVSPSDFLVITPCVLQGGTTGNIIPDSAFMQGTIRTYNPKVRELAKKRVEEVAKGIGAAYRCDVEVKYYRGCPSIDNDPKVRKEIVDYTSELIGAGKVLDSEQYPESGSGKMSGSEDFSFVSERVPSTMLWLVSNITNEDGKNYPHHHPRVQFDEEALPIGAAIYANSAIEWLKNN